MGLAHAEEVQAEAACDQLASCYIVSRLQERVEVVEHTLDSLLDIQRVWLSHERTFTSPYGMRMLPIEGALFRELDSHWRQLMAAIHSDPSRCLACLENCAARCDLALETKGRLEQSVRQLLSPWRAEVGVKIPQLTRIHDDDLLLLFVSPPPVASSYELQPLMRELIGWSQVDVDDAERITAVHHPAHSTTDTIERITLPLATPSSEGFSAWFPTLVEQLEAHAAEQVQCAVCAIASDGHSSLLDTDTLQAAMVALNVHFTGTIDSILSNVSVCSEFGLSRVKHEIQGHKRRLASVPNLEGRVKAKRQALVVVMDNQIKRVDELLKVSKELMV